VTADDLDANACAPKRFSKSRRFSGTPYTHIGGTGFIVSVEGRAAKSRRNAALAEKPATAINGRDDVERSGGRDRVPVAGKLSAAEQINADVFIHRFIVKPRG
jgi:hypothetical protein